MVNSACVPPPKPNKELKPYWWAIVLFSLAFFVQGVIFLRYPGLQTDEVLFAAPFFRSQGGGFYLQIGPWKVLLMSLTYLGALKTWLYAPILWLAEPSVTVIRVPAVLIGSTTVAFFGVLLARIHGSRAAWVGCAHEAKTGRCALDRVSLVKLQIAPLLAAYATAFGQPMAPHSDAIATIRP